MATPKAPFDSDEESLILAHLSVIVERLGLQHWKVLLSRHSVTADPGEAPDNAQLHMSDTRWVAVLQLGPHWAKRSGAAKANTLLHEMLHLLTRGVCARASMWALRLPRNMGHVALNDVNNEEELLVDRLATLMTGMMPDWGDVDSQYRSPSVVLEDEWC